MCGRFSYFIGNDILEKYFQLPHDPERIQPKYNIAPNEETYVIINRGTNELKLMKWGLIPHWSPDSSTTGKMINAKSETIWDKSAFKHSIAKKRCVIPASGFFEWTNAGDQRIPYFIFIEDQALMPLGGIYDVWYSQFGYTITSFSIITTPPNTIIEKIHDRMPLILNRQNVERWLDPTINKKMVEAIMRPYEGQMNYYTVSSYVNNPKNKSVECIKEFEYGSKFNNLEDYF